MANFVVVAPGYSPNSGGNVALHKLADTLDKCGENSYIYIAYIAPGHKNPNWGGKEINNRELMELEDPIIIYPEVVSGNPIGAKNVVRWLLNKPGAINGSKNFSNNEIFFQFWPFFGEGYEVAGDLRVLDLQLEKFFDMGIPRKGQSFVVRKGRHKNLNQHDPSAVCIDGASIDEMNLIFNQTETFISYDHATYLSVLAALAGCTSIVVPDGETSAEDWKNKINLHKYGIAYGFEDIDHAKQTIHLVRSHVESFEKENFELVKKFIGTCKDIFKVC